MAKKQVKKKTSGSDNTKFSNIVVPKLYLNIPKIGTQVFFNEKIGKINLNSVGVFAGIGLSNYWNNAVIHEEGQITKDQHNMLGNFVCKYYFIITRVGKTGKPRFDFCALNVPCFNTSIMECTKNYLENTYPKNMASIIPKEDPLLLGVQNENLYNLNEIQSIDVINDLDQKEFFSWLCARMLALKIRRQGAGSKQPMRPLSALIQIIDGMTSSVVVQNNYKPPEDLINDYIKLVKTPEVRKQAIEELRFLESRETNLRHIYLKKLINMIFLTHNSITERLEVESKENDKLNKDDKDYLKAFLNSQDNRKISKLFRESASLFTKEIKTKTQKEKFNDLCNRFL